MPTHLEFQSETALVTIITLGYRARCTEPQCRNLGRCLLRYADGGGRPLSKPGALQHPTRSAIEGETRAGQTIYDERGAVESKRP